MDFQPDYCNLVEAAWNRKPPRLPLYEHLINPESIANMLDRNFLTLWEGDRSDRVEFARITCEFWKEMTYDTVSYETCITEILPGGGALIGERDGVIANRADFESYPWDDLSRRFWELATPRFEAYEAAMPEGMRAMGGVGNGPYEVACDLVGFQQLCYLQADDPELFAEVFVRIGDLFMEIWGEFLKRWTHLFVVCRIGDDMGFKTGTLLAPQTLIDHVVPQYARVVGLIRQAGQPFLLHSCGKIFEIMEPLLATGITAKHSNEDAISTFDEWIERYGDRIGLFGGIDTDRLCRMAPDDICAFVLDQGGRFREKARGFALGSGNSIPEYVPAEGFYAMIRAAKELRRREEAA